MIFSPDLEGKNGGVPSMRMQVILDSSFRPPGFSPYMGREERRVQGLDYIGCRLQAENVRILKLVLLSHGRELKQMTFLSHGRKQEVNISLASTVVSPRFSN